MSDYIKREDAIEIIARHDDTDGTIKVFSGRFVNGLISAIPPADVRENVKGEWIDRGKDMMLRWQCSECGRRDTHIYNFCPDCGADMRGDNNGKRNDS